MESPRREDSLSPAGGRPLPRREEAFPHGEGGPGEARDG